MIRTVTPRLVLLAAVLASACTPPDAGRPDYRLRAYLKVLAAEDSRHTAGANLETLERATESPDVFLRRAGVRAMGRAEAPELLEHIVPLLGDENPLVRAEAANAMAQAVHRGDGSAALTHLEVRLPSEEHPAVRGVIARSLGRLSLGPQGRTRVAQALVALSLGPEGGHAPSDQLLGAVLGMESFVRGSRGTPVGDPLTNRLRQLITYDLDEVPQTPTMDRIRALAVSALGAAGGLSIHDVEASLRDPGDKTRRAAAVRANIVVPPDRPEFIARVLRDPSAQVRQEGVRALAGDDRDEFTCASLLDVATQDLSTGARLAALDALALPCPETGAQIQLLTTVASSLATQTQDWHEPAHAMVSLAALSSASAASLLPRFVGHSNPFVRSYAARAAGRLGDAAQLRTLAADDVPNVKTAALTELARVQRSGMDPLLLATLERADEPQLIMTAAALLEDTELPDQAASTGLATLARLSALGEQTLRDARVALLSLIAQVGEPTLAPEIAPYIRDSDRRIADLASEILRDWTGDRYISAPRTPVRLALPTEDEMEELSRASVVLHMARGGTIDISLNAYGTTTTSFRFMKMAREGAFDGLTLHRVVPNFVVQGGSPHANEYAGHGAFTRDEVGLPVQWRGTVGISTRGRDTGDGQIYFNLVDNVRLDHDYTIVGIVTTGMEAVDAVMEGDVIERAEVRIAR